MPRINTDSNRHRIVAQELAQQAWMMKACGYPEEYYRWSVEAVEMLSNMADVFDMLRREDAQDR